MVSAAGQIVTNPSPKLLINNTALHNHFLYYINVKLGAFFAYNCLLNYYLLGNRFIFAFILTSQLVKTRVNISMLSQMQSLPPAHQFDCRIRKANPRRHQNVRSQRPVWAARIAARHGSGT